MSVSLLFNMGAVLRAVFSVFAWVVEPEFPHLRALGADDVVGALGLEEAEELRGNPVGGRTGSYVVTVD